MNNDIAVFKAATDGISLQQHSDIAFYPSSPLQANKAPLRHFFLPDQPLSLNTTEGCHPTFERDPWSSTLDPQLEYSYSENTYPTGLLDLQPFEILDSPSLNSAHQEDPFPQAIVTNAQATFTIWEDKDPFVSHPAEYYFASQPATADSVLPRVQKRKLGRPRGAQNKPKEDTVKEPKKVGRPLGALDSRPRKKYKGNAHRKNAKSSSPPEGTSQIASEEPDSPTMPYNNAAIAPPEEITGGCSLPLARVKKILHIDEDTHQVSNNASYVITVATEMFIRYLAEQALNVVKAEKKPRRNIQYKDLANAVARIDNLQFLEDVIPQTTTYREYKARRANKATEVPQPLQNGQTTLDGSRALPQQETDGDQAGASGDALNVDDTLDDKVAGTQRPESSRSNGNGLVFEHYEPNGVSKRDDSGDVEMS